MSYRVVNKSLLGCGDTVYGAPVTRAASAQDFESPQLKAAKAELEGARAFTQRMVQERSLAGVMGAEKAKLAMLQAMDSIKRAEAKVLALGGKL